MTHPPEGPRVEHPVANPDDDPRAGRTVIDTMPIRQKLWLALALVPGAAGVWLRSGGMILAIALGVGAVMGLTLRSLSARGYHETPLWWGVVWTAVVIVVIAFLVGEL